MADISYEIIEHYGILSTTKAGWHKELNLVSWNEGRPRLDLREWDPDHERMGRGVTLTEEEAQTLAALLATTRK